MFVITRGWFMKLWNRRGWTVLCRETHGERCRVGRLGHGRMGQGPPNILVVWATMHLAPPIIDMYVHQIGAIIWQILRLMHQIHFPLGCAPDPAGGAYNAPSDPIAVFKGLLLRGGRGRGGVGDGFPMERGGERKVKGEKRKSGWREGFGPPKKFGVALPMEKPSAVSILEYAEYTVTTRIHGMRKCMTVKTNYEVLVTLRTLQFVDFFVVVISIYVSHCGLQTARTRKRKRLCRE